jgi:uncharacterized membrane protein YozB (DUF420 family)
LLAFDALIAIFTATASEIQVATTAISDQGNPARQSSPRSVVQLAVLAAILAVVTVFVVKYPFRYYLNYNEAAFTDPDHGAPNYWSMRAWLLMHITGGTVAALTGPFQFWTGLRTRYVQVHRWMGRIFLSGVAVGSIGAFRLAIVTTQGWAFGVGLVALVMAWSSSAAMAYYAIRKGRVQIHKEWMIRTYVVTFAFVLQRVIQVDFPGLTPDGDRAITSIWASWVFTFLITGLILQVRTIRASGVPGRTA